MAAGKGGWPMREAPEPGGNTSGDDPAYAGQAIYSPATLALYDFVVLTLSNPLVWRCPTRRILELYDRHATGNHLDVGVGTGWYLDRCKFPAAAPRIGLLDLNRNSLAAAARRIARHRPEQYQADVLKPLTVSALPFQSIALTYLLHCLPGDITQKAVVFDNLAPLLAPDGVMFGATLLSSGVERSAAARALMHVYNGKGVFSNAADSVEALQAALDRRFDFVQLDIIGCAALFVGKHIRSSGSA
jgi:SAM-dependent methyltransferase